MVPVIRALVAVSAIVAATAQPNASGPDLDNATYQWQLEKADKMAAVNKVVRMLEDLQTQVNMEGEEEAHMYNEFACFCKGTMKEKNEAVKEGDDAKTAITSEINLLMARRNQLDGEMRKIEQVLRKTKKDMDEAQETRDKEAKQYQFDETDLTGALEALAGALQELKATRTYVNTPYEGADLLQTTRQAVGEKIRHTLLFAEALGFAPEVVRNATAFFQNPAPPAGAPDIPTEAYSFKSDGIIDTLEDLEKKFRAEKTRVDKAEVDATALHNQYMQDQDYIIKTKQKEMEDAQKEKSNKQADIAVKSNELTTIATELLADQEYLTELGRMCHEKAVTWDQRSKMRAEELQAITTCLGILKGVVTDKISGATVRFNQFSVSLKLAEDTARDESAMEAVEASAEAAEAGAAPSFLQHARGPIFELLSRSGPQAEERAREAAINLLKSSSTQLKSTTLASLVSQLSDDPFAKVKELIEELIERLLREAANEATQKGWCDKSMAAASQKRDYAAEAIEELNGNMAELEALRDKLAEELKVLGDQIKKLKDDRREAEQMRKREAREHAIIISEASVGVSAMNEAIRVIDRYYKTAKKSEVEFSFLQNATDFDIDDNNSFPNKTESYEPVVTNTNKPTLKPVLPGDHAPDTGFASGDAYKGVLGVDGGIVGMLEVIRDDFARTITETQKAEQQAQQDHLEFMTESGKSLAEKNVAKTEKTKQKDDAEDKLQDDKDSLIAKTDILKTSVQELIQLHGACVDTGISWEERIARREDEIAALKKALCILESYEKYGPNGIGDDGSC